MPNTYILTQKNFPRLWELRSLSGDPVPETAFLYTAVHPIGGGADKIRYRQWQDLEQNAGREFDEGFVGKLKCDLHTAEIQLKAHQISNVSRRIALIVINDDDILHEYIGEKIEQLEQIIVDQPPYGIEVEFLAHPPFYTSMGPR